MKYDLQIHSESTALLRSELKYVIEYCGTHLGFSECELLFGWAWRSNPDSQELSWETVCIPTSEIASVVQHAEDASLGRFGNDDIWITFRQTKTKIQFCHHSGIHLSYVERDAISEQFLGRWHELGLSPIEQMETEPS